MLQRHMDSNSKKQDKQNDKNGRRHQKIMESQHCMDKKLKGIKTMLSKIAKALENYEDQTEDEDDDDPFKYSSSDEDEDDSQSVSSDD
ncbi:kinesin-related protein 4-like [Mytilus trossulus]|uniref:kinesin-related protein 4-like n=1 Tax=Mytilus trossulus TaxID=6551 RepID=UPI003004E620